MNPIFPFSRLAPIIAEMFPEGLGVADGYQKNVGTGSEKFSTDQLKVGDPPEPFAQET